MKTCKTAYILENKSPNLVAPRTKAFRSNDHGITFECFLNLRKIFDERCLYLAFLFYSNVHTENFIWNLVKSLRIWFSLTRFRNYFPWCGKNQASKIAERKSERKKERSFFKRECFKIPPMASRFL